MCKNILSGKKKILTCSVFEKIIPGGTTSTFQEVGG